MTKNNVVNPLIIGLSGASGVIYGVKLLEITHKMPDVQTALVVSDAARRTLKYETDYDIAYLEGLCDDVYPVKDIGAKIASGSYTTRGMVIAPCSVKTMSEIACGITGTLLSRAADVCLKERRTLVLGVREMPFHTGHLQTMTRLSQMGAVIAPPLPAFYNKHQTIDDMVHQICLRWLSLFGIEGADKKVWLDD